MNSVFAPFVARPSVPKLLLLVAGSLLFVIGGVLLANGYSAKPGSEWIGWLSIIFFGFCGVVGLGRLLDRDDQIRLDTTGLYWKRWSDDTIPWNQIANVRQAQVRRQRFLCIDLVNPARYPSTRLLGRVAKMNKAMGFGDIALSATGTDKRFDELRDAVLARWSAYGRR